MSIIFTMLCNLRRLRGYMLNPVDQVEYSNLISLFEHLYQSGLIPSIDTINRYDNLINKFRRI